MGRVRSITRDPRYRDLVRRYRYDWTTAAVECSVNTPPGSRS